MRYADLSVTAWRRRGTALFVCASALLDCSFPEVIFDPTADASVDGGPAAKLGDHAMIAEAGPSTYGDEPASNGPETGVYGLPGDAHGEPLIVFADSGASTGDASVLADAGARESGGSSGSSVTGSTSGSGSGSGSGGSGSSSGWRQDSGSSSGGGQGCWCEGGLTRLPTGILCAAIVIDPSLPPGQAKKACRGIAGFMDTNLACGQPGTYVTCDISPGGTMCQVASQVPMTQTCQ